MSNLQQINLFLPEFRPAQHPFRFVAILSAWAAIIVFFALIQLWGWHRTQESRERLADMEQQQIKVLQQLRNLRDSTPQSTKAQIDSSIDEARAEVAQRRQVLQLMKGRNIGNSEGFSHFLVSLSRQHMDGLSLEHFGLIDGGNYIELSGWTYRPELVPDYLQRLQKEDSFSNTRFGDMSIKRIAGRRADALWFVLGDKAGGGS